MARRRGLGWPMALWTRAAAASLKRAARTARNSAKTTERAMRAATRAAQSTPRRASRPAPARKTRVAPARAVKRKDDSAGLAIRAGAARHFRLHVPAGVRRDARLPLVVLLHGCRQDAQTIAAVSRMNRLADRERFVVLYPEQDRLAHSQGCWNWYEVRTGRARVEAAIVQAAVDQVCRTAPVDPARIVIAGLSAGASMAALVATLKPAGYAAVAMHAGVAPGVAHDASGALAAMGGHPRGGREPPLTAARTAALPPLLVIHGTADTVVAASNGREAAARWAAAAGAHAAPPRRVQRGSRRPMRITDYRVQRRLVVRLCEVEGLGHAWSGGAPGRAYSDPRGPDASRLVWSFARAAFGGRAR